MIHRRQQNERKRKIQLLRDITAGKRSCRELNTMDVALDIQNEDGTFCVGPHNEQKLTAEQYEAYKAEHPARLRVLVVPLEGCEPIKD